MVFAGLLQIWFQQGSISRYGIDLCLFVIPIQWGTIPSMDASTTTKRDFSLVFTFKDESA
ncbi:MAG: hypothetical protein DME54_15295 [Verrucomicrobia bacterium]|nr:MAG: hypothetical protein DME62_10475 [Verrucomicrobiota bacterium]PYK32700.1 MAG: hypothetical protein DME54_15295 [Verrucomicrobiota bacterium]